MNGSRPLGHSQALPQQPGRENEQIRTKYLRHDVQPALDTSNGRVHVAAELLNKGLSLEGCVHGEYKGLGGDVQVRYM